MNIYFPQHIVSIIFHSKQIHHMFTEIWTIKNNATRNKGNVRREVTPVYLIYYAFIHMSSLPLTSYMVLVNLEKK